jgi:hypothetical protein
LLQSALELSIIRIDTFEVEMEVGVGKLIYSIFLLGLLAQATADQKAKRIYERYYYDEIEGKWFYTLPDPNHRYPEKRNSSISCPLHSHFVLRVVGFGGNEVGECKCEKEFNNSPDRRHCIGTQSRGEPCGDDLVPCSTYAGLTCQNGACDCQPDAEWDDEDSLCYSDKICRSRDEVRSTIPTHHLNALRVSTPPANWKHIIMDALETPLVSLTKDCLARDLVFANVTVASHTTLRGSCAIEFGLGVILVRKLTHVASAYFV